MGEFALFFLKFLFWYLREDEEEGGRADQEAGGRAHRDEGAGFHGVGAAGGHPVLRALIGVPSPTESTATGARAGEPVSACARLCGRRPASTPERRGRERKPARAEEPTAAAARALPHPDWPRKARAAQMPPPVYPQRWSFTPTKPRENINPHGELSFLQSHKSQQIFIKTHHP